MFSRFDERSKGAAFFGILAILVLTSSCGSGEEPSSPSIEAPAAPAQAEEPVMNAPMHVRFFCAPGGILNNVACNPPAGNGLAGILHSLERLDFRENELLLVTGNLFPYKPEGLDPYNRRFFEFKLNALADFYGAMGIHSALPGSNDLRMGMDRLGDLLESSGMEAVCANLVRRDSGETVFAPYRIQERAGIKVGVTGVITPTVKITAEGEEEEEQEEETDSKTGSPKRKLESVPLATLIPGGDYELLDPLKSLSSAADRMKQEGAEFIVALCFVGPALVEEILGLGVVDLAIGNFRPTRDEYRVLEGGGILAETQKGAHSLGDFEYYRGASSPGPAIDRVEVTALVKKRSDLEQKISLLEKRYGTDRIEKIETLAFGTEDASDYRGFQRELERTAAQIEELEKQSNKHYFHQHYVASAGYVHEEEGQAGRMWRAFLDQVNRFNEENRAGIEAEGEAWLAQYFRPVENPSSCSSCHPEQTAFWQNTAHARSFESVSRMGCDGYIKCQHCHATGFACQESFLLPPPPDGFDSVNCESCHGFSHRHLEDFLEPTAGKYKIENHQELKTICSNCHDSSRSPGFNFMEALEKTACPPLDLQSDLLQALLVNRNREIDEIFSRGEFPEDPLFYLRAANLKKRLALGNRAVADVLMKGLESYPYRKVLVYEAYPLLLREKRFQEALEILEAYVSKNQTDKQINVEIIRLLAHGPSPEVDDPERARDYIRWFLQDIEKDNVEMALLLATVELKLGNREGAEEAVNFAKKLKISPDDKLWLEMIEKRLEAL